jgi:hypothetical protein
MSEETVHSALKAGWKYNSLFQSENVTERVFGVEDKEEAMKKFKEGELAGLEDKYKDMGKVGLAKPSYCWSWFIELDDGVISKMSFDREFDWFKAV